MDCNALNIFTDGSCQPNPGGVGIRFVFPEYLSLANIDICPPGYSMATNNQMELKACCLALQESIKLERKWQRIVVNTDSMYVVDNINNAKYNWSKNKWFKSGGAPVLNSEQWKELLKLIVKCGIPVDFNWVKGHKKSVDNKAADYLADKSAKGRLNNPIKNKLIRRKKTLNKTKIGSITIKGQQMQVAIIGGEYLNKQKISRYRYEVISKRSPYFGLVDFIFSEISLRTGHKYSVRVNNNQKYPQIVKIIRDLTQEQRKREGCQL